MEEKKLYPMKFQPKGVEMPWGTLVYQMADLGYVDSGVANGWFEGNSFSELMQTFLERVSGDNAFEYYGTQFPVMVKVLNVEGRTSLRINPADTDAQERYDAFGKTVVWYVEQAQDDALIYLGFKKDVGAEEFYDACTCGSPEHLLNVIKPSAGNFYLLPHGVVHGATGHLKIIEIGECSELSFRLYDWQRNDENRELELEEAFDLIDFNRFDLYTLPSARPDGELTELLAKTAQFSLRRMDVKAPLRIAPSEFDSFIVYYCVSGKLTIKTSKNAAEGLELVAGNSCLVPAELDEVYLIPETAGTVVLESIFEPRQDPDSYTGNSESVEPFEAD